MSFVFTLFLILNNAQRGVAVDALFCPSYLFRFNFCWTLGLFVSRFEFGSRAYFRYIVYLFYRVFESFCVSYLFHVIFYLISNYYLCLTVVSSCGVISYRIVFVSLIIVYAKCHCFLLINYVRDKYFMSC